MSRRSVVIHDLELVRTGHPLAEWSSTAVLFPMCMHTGVKRSGPFKAVGKNRRRQADIAQGLHCEARRNIPARVKRGFRTLERLGPLAPLAAGAPLTRPARSWRPAIIGATTVAHRRPVVSAARTERWIRTVCPMDGIDDMQVLLDPNTTAG